ncbi:MAG TPA: alpha/beta hydrolase [Candidatus Angelobacter sp.]|nr:alpha/beta hydrolase [Candidatus Angelobacter sp.]
MNTLSKSLLVLALSAAVTGAADELKEVLLWPNGAPGSEGRTGQEIVQRGANGERSVFRVHRPSITPYLPPKDKATGTAVLVIPGGGHRVLAIEHEGYNAAQKLSEHGIAAFVLKYRLARETNSTYRVEVEALADTQRALRLVRSRAQEWGVDPARLGVMGFSAGGELAALASMKFDNGVENATDEVDHHSSRPAFQALIYPGSSRKIDPVKESPPVFLACAYNDRQDIAEGLAEAYLRFKRAGVPAELHIYGSGGHGFGVRTSNRKPVGSWLTRFEEWLGDAGFLQRP